MKSRRSQRGFTLIELMVSLVLFAFVTAGMLSVATTMARGFREQEATITTESATRSTLDFLSEAVRTASPGVPSLNITNATCGTQAIQIANNDTSIPDKPTTHASDRLTMVFPSGWIYTSVREDFTSNASTLKVAHSGNQLAKFDQVLVTDFTQGHVMTVDAVSGDDITLIANGCAPVIYKRGSVVIRVKRAGFYVAMLPSDAKNREVPALMMDPTPDDLTNNDEEPIAEGIEDLQVAVAIDGEDGGTTITEIGLAAGDDEWIGNFPGELIPAILDTQTVRAIRISVIARNARDAPGINFFTIPALEDRATVATNDSFRRRLLSTIIELRNLGASP